MKYRQMSQDKNLPSHFFYASSFLAMIFFPFWSLPIAPVLYRPVSALFFLLLSPAYFARKTRVPWADIILFTFALVGSIQTLVILWAIEERPDIAIRSLAPLWLGVASYCGVVGMLRVRSAASIIQGLGTGGILLTALGYLEFCFNVIGFDGLKFVLGFLSDEAAMNRIQLFTREASWAAKCLVFYIPFIRYSPLSRRTNSLMEKAAWLLLLLTFSLDGIFGAAFGGAVFVTVVAFKKRRFSAILTSLTGAIFISSFILIFREEIAQSISDFNLYFVDRLIPLLRYQDARHAIANFAYYDNSTFIRIFFPLAGFHMFLDFPLGWGLGSFPLHFADYIPLSQISLEAMPEVRDNLDFGSGDPKSMYAKLAAECGLISAPFFVIFMWLCFRSAYRSRSPYARSILLSYCMTIGVLLQFGSFLYLPMWFSFALCLNVTRSSNTNTNQH